jgi:hypothetical protein
MMKYNATGDNNFLKVMQAIDQILSRSSCVYIPVAIFMTDGIWHDDGAANYLKTIMERYSTQGFKLNVVAIGPSINRPLMQQFADIGKGTFTSSPLNLTEMKSVYAHLAGRLE